MANSEKEYLKNYNIHNYDIPLVSVEIAIFTLVEGKLHILMVERGEFPHKNRSALPGGFVDQKRDKDLTATALRKLVEKTGIKTPHLEQVVSVGNLKRDPRGWSVTVLYMALIPYSPTAAFVENVADAKWWPYDAALKLSLAFDHSSLIEQARDRLKQKTAYTVLPIHVLKAPFTLTQLQQAFEELMGREIEKKSFRRRMLAVDLLDEVGEGLPEGGRGRTAVFYQPKQGIEAHAFNAAFEL